MLEHTDNFHQTSFIIPHHLINVSHPTDLASKVKILGRHQVAIWGMKVILLKTIWPQQISL